MFPSTTPIQDRGGNLVPLSSILIAGRTNQGQRYAPLFMEPTGDEFTYGGATTGRINSVHEVGHMLGSNHTSGCIVGDDGFTDDEWPQASLYANGHIGVNGWDIRTYLDANPTLIAPTTNDLMGACTPLWISDFNFTKWWKALNP